jgi:hypothetical protein
VLEVWSGFFGEVVLVYGEAEAAPEIGVLDHRGRVVWGVGFVLFRTGKVDGGREGRCLCGRAPEDVAGRCMDARDGGFVSFVYPLSKLCAT